MLMGIVRNGKRFTQFIKNLEKGWEIEEPVLLGALWQADSERDGAYHFILKNRYEDKTTMVSLPPSSELLLFLAENNIKISPIQR